MKYKFNTVLITESGRPANVWIEFENDPPENIEIFGSIITSHIFKIHPTELEYSRAKFACCEYLDKLYNFSDSWEAIEFGVHETAKIKGWWDHDRNDGEAIALIHSELSEALETLRHGNKQSEHIPEFSGLEEELADVVIRIMDYASGRRLQLAKAILAKIEFNKTRPPKHGGKVF